jgi:hypothetical protein
MRGGNGTLDRRYLAIAFGLAVVVIAASLWLFPEWRQSPALLIVPVRHRCRGRRHLLRMPFARRIHPQQDPQSARRAGLRLAPAPPRTRRTWSPACARPTSTACCARRCRSASGWSCTLDQPAGVLQRPMVLVEGREIRRLLAGDRTSDMAAIFRDSGRALLILGAPGSGKTVTLLELCAPLLAQAEADPREPVPVVLNLSTWAQKLAPLAEWIVDRMWPEYGLNKQITPAWLAAGHLTLLLDGLDEVRPDARAACVRAINDFRESHGAGMVVCSRSADYGELRERLALAQAVEIRPLEPAQIDAYLTDERLGLAAVQEAIARDDALRELATTPLMLNIMALAYGGRPLAELLPLLEDDNERRAHLYDAYLARMFRRKPPADASYSVGQVLGWLRFIAAQLTRRNETQFFIEDLQPDWLPGKRERLVAVMLGVMLGVVFGVVFGAW